MEERTVQVAAINTNVRELYDIVIRRIALTKSECEPFIMTIACRTTRELDAYNLIRKRFDANWWADKLIIDIKYIGKLHMIDDIPLYEFD